MNEMQLNKLLDTLKNRNSKKPKKAALKIEKQKKLSTQEFLKAYEEMWQAGPEIKYQNPGAIEKYLQSAINYPNL
jgi:hypothetical protein